jgi:hypothetical protein
MRDNSLVLRRMAQADLSLALEWAADEGWNPGLHDAHCFYAADSRGFFLGELDGAPIGCVSAIRYGSGSDSWACTSSRRRTAGKASALNCGGLLCTILATA